MTDERALVEMFHSALDRQDVSGPFQRLRLELEKPGAARLRTGRRIFMTRNRLALLAAALVLIVLSGVFFGTRLLTPTAQVPAGAGQLLTRPLTLSHVTTAASCPDGPYTTVHSGPFTYLAYGKGPVYALAGTTITTSWGTYWNITATVDPHTAGPIVVRGKDLITGWPVVFTGAYGVGAPYGTDVLDGSGAVQYTAIAFDPSRPESGGKWSWRSGMKHGWSGCDGLQVDGPSFSETLYSSGPTT